jgi:hypothetical protein
VNSSSKIRWLTGCPMSARRITSLPSGFVVTASRAAHGGMWRPHETRLASVPGVARTGSHLNLAGTAGRLRCANDRDLDEMCDPTIIRFAPDAQSVKLFTDEATVSR